MQKQSFIKIQKKHLFKVDIKHSELTENQRDLIKLYTVTIQTTTTFSKSMGMYIHEHLWSVECDVHNLIDTAMRTILLSPETFNITISLFDLNATELSKKKYHGCKISSIFSELNYRKSGNKCLDITMTSHSKV